MRQLTAIILSLTLLVSANVFTGKAIAAEANKNSLTITRNGSNASEKAPTEFFTGNVRLESLFSANDLAKLSGHSVTFEPRSRTVWHTHPAWQILIVTAGVGWVQEWGGPIVEIRPGDVAWIPVGVKHWHGATSTTAMTHISLTGMLDGKNVEWLEPVSDEEYHK